VRSALGTLPWVEQDSIIPDVKRQQVTFGIKDKKRFDLAQLKQAIEGQTSFKLGEVLSGP
jgi:hypothetical protein